MTLAVVCDNELESGELCMRQQQVRGMDPEERAEFLRMIGWTTNEKGWHVCPDCGGPEQRAKLDAIFNQGGALDLDALRELAVAERVVARRRRTDKGDQMSNSRKPTLDELEAILNDEEDVEILPNGEIRQPGTANEKPASSANDGRPLTDPHRARGRMLRIIESLGDVPVMLVLDEQQQDVQPLMSNAQGLPPTSEADVARVEYAVVEQPSRLRADSLRHLGDGVLEARAKGQGEDGKEITLLHYFDVAHVRRFFVQSALDVDLSS